MNTQGRVSLGLGDPECGSWRPRGMLMEGSPEYLGRVEQGAPSSKGEGRGRPATSHAATSQATHCIPIANQA